MSKPFKSNRNVVFSCKYHVVWCTKYRRPLLVEDIASELKTLLLNTAASLLADIIEMEVMPDHIHLLLNTDPQYGIHKVVKRLKGQSSRVLRRQFNTLRSRVPTLWTNSYFISTIGGAPLEVIKEYIANQTKV